MFSFTSFFFHIWTVTGMKNTVRYSEDFVMLRFVISEFRCTITNDHVRKFWSSSVLNESARECAKSTFIQILWRLSYASDRTPIKCPQRRPNTEHVAVDVTVLVFIFSCCDKKIVWSPICFKLIPRVLSYTSLRIERENLGTRLRFVSQFHSVLMSSLTALSLVFVDFRPVFYSSIMDTSSPAQERQIFLMENMNRSLDSIETGRSKRSSAARYRNSQNRSDLHVITATRLKTVTQRILSRSSSGFKGRFTFLLLWWWKEMLLIVRVCAYSLELNVPVIACLQRHRHACVVF